MQRVRLLVSLIAMATVTIVAAQRPPAPPAPRDPAAFQREAGAGRPTKAERRALDRLRSDE